MIEPGTNLIEGLKPRYAEAHRAYHTWDHIEALLRLHHQYTPLFDDPSRVLWALYWHDAVYDPTASDNEIQSARLLRREAEGILPSESLDEAAQIIEATTGHTIPDDVAPALRRDLTLFLDLDLSILGQTQPVFDAYEVAIRAEYAFVEETIYRQARAAILSRFLERERLFFNDEFNVVWEKSARDNLKRSIAALR